MNPLEKLSYGELVERFYRNNGKLAHTPINDPRRQEIIQDMNDVDAELRRREKARETWKK